jgi:hypothetical protein
LSILNSFYLIIASEGRSQGEQSEKDTKVIASVKIKNQRPPVKTKKMTKPENKPTPKPWME